jgi:hypothetical protein
VTCLGERCHATFTAQCLRVVATCWFHIASVTVLAATGPGPLGDGEALRTPATGQPALVAQHQAGHPTRDARKGAPVLMRPRAFPSDDSAMGPDNEPLRIDLRKDCDSTSGFRLGHTRCFHVGVHGARAPTASYSQYKPSSGDDTSDRDAAVRP